MNKQNLSKLQKRAKGSTILYIEDNKLLQDKLGKFLNLTFDTCYQAFEGNKGVEKFQKYLPDIILTDLTFDTLSGVDLIMELQDINNDTAIIVLSNKNSDLELLEDFDMGLIDILIKPVNVNKLMLSLIKALKKNYETNVDISFFDNLISLQDKQTKVELINSFKGINIINKGIIVSVVDDEYKIKIPHIQTIAIRLQQISVMKFPKQDKYILAVSLNINTKTDIITFYKPKYIDYHTRNRELKRVKTDKSFQIGLHFKTQNIEVLAIDISYDYISMLFENPTIQFKQNDEVDITLGFNISSASSMISEKRFVKAFAKGKIKRIQPNKIGQNILSSLKISKADTNIFNQYLQERELQIISSLKNLLI